MMVSVPSSRQSLKRSWRTCTAAMMQPEAWILIHWAGVMLPFIRPSNYAWSHQRHLFSTTAQLLHFVTRAYSRHGVTSMCPVYVRQLLREEYALPLPAQAFPGLAWQDLLLI